MDYIEEIRKNKSLIALILRDKYDVDGVHFLTEDGLSQQVAYMHHPTGKVIDAHVHNLVQRNVIMTQEVIIIKRGKLRVDFYDIYQTYLESRVLCEGDVLLLVSGGHGFEVLEEVQMIEVKQGPYSGEDDKERFEAVDSTKLIVR